MSAFKTEIKDGDALAGMSDDIRGYYLEKRAFLRESVVQTVPERVTEEWWNKALGKRHYQVDLDFVQEAIYEPMRCYLTQSGKMLRPLLVTLCLEGYGKDPGKHMPAVAMGEILHCASLMVDDIADRSDLRRGKPTAHSVYGITRAAGASLNLLAYVYVLLMHNVMNLDPLISLRLYEAIIWEHYMTSLGVALDIQWSLDKRTRIPKDFFLQHVANRSGSYTYRVPIRIGSIVGEAPDKDLAALFSFGQWVGLAFQMKDDLLNLRPECESWGKVVGEDVTEGKRSLMVLYTFEKADKKDYARFEEILNSGTKDPALIQEAIAIMDKYGCLDQVQVESQTWIDRACSELEETTMLPEYKELLSSFARYCVVRNM